MIKKEFSESLLETIKSSDSQGLATDFAEIAFDNFTDLEGLAKDIPIIGSVVKVAKLGFSVKDILFLNKLGNFLFGLSDISQEKRQALICKLEKDSNYRTDVGAKIWLLLERVDDFEKPSIIATAFKAYLEEDISYIQLQKINYAIDHLFIGDLEEFLLFYRDAKHKMDESTNQNLALCGFAILVQIMGGGTEPEITELGRLFAENVLSRKK